VFWSKVGAQPPDPGTLATDGRALPCALDFPPAERAAFLDGSCTDLDLRREVDILLSKEKEAGSFLETAVIADLTAGLVPGRQFGPHRIVSRIGAAEWERFTGRTIGSRSGCGNQDIAS